jgi:hypothetical protein
VLPLGLFPEADIVYYGGIGPAIAELPFNILQAVLCGFIAVLLAEGIERSYPQIANLRG